ncbi:NAD(P)-dependent oxidoreductase [Tropicimonas sp. IMCC6043]|uniref:NAD-dependent epimerase/dehydratase family protein n=1 Tax=Tropicimonas sp. IMCC6043 TaxID=2510645 RepID=UPI00101C691B|nr:NAD(P)-dependent oxidoreductase [Tropicimonas sp. IMCC6043]RYH07528.1 NAD(P)-dependent oxidoreductase [Tropicimonas sp. IMCC6043]
MKILVTGASGHVARMGLSEIAKRHELRLTDIVSPPSPPAGATFTASDLLNADDASFSALFKGVETVIHSAYLHSSKQGDVYGAEPPQIDRFETELDNIRIAQRVYRHAYEAGVRRVVMVSSNHAADWYEHSQIHARRREMITPDDYPLSDNFYGWAKASYELLGFPYACGTFGRRLEVVSLRIGAPYPIDAGKFLDGGASPELSLPKPGGVAGFKRALATYLSPGDCAELFRAAAEAPEIEGRDGVPWLVVYGISDNTRAFWSLDSARRQLGYEPKDDSEILYGEEIDRIVRSGASSGKLGS